jgi:hypothetical protein
VKTVQQLLIVALVAMGGLNLAPARAQSTESDLTPESVAEGLDKAQYALPDVPDKDLANLKVEDARDRFSVKFGIVGLRLPAARRHDGRLVGRRELVGDAALEAEHRLRQLRPRALRRRRQYGDAAEPHSVDFLS